jgi:hypothetical protein
MTVRMHPFDLACRHASESSMLFANSSQFCGFRPQRATTGTVLWRLNNKSAKVRQQAADLISRIAVVMMKCDQEQYMNHLGVILYENLGEEYPEVCVLHTHVVCLFV